jgi:hypothetical protein
VAIDSEGKVIAVGFVYSQISDEWTSGYIVKYDLLGDEEWNIPLEMGSVEEGTKSMSTDICYGVAVDAEDKIIVVGGVSGPPAGYTEEDSYSMALLVQKYEPDGFQTSDAPLWGIAWHDSPTSPLQIAYGVDVDGSGDIYVAGNAHTDATIQGQWATLKLSGENADALLGPLYHNNNPYYYLNDASYDVAVDAEGNIVVVGMVGVSGTVDGLANDFDWHVRKYNATGALLWEDTYSGGADLEDCAKGVAVDDEGNIFVVGYTNRGTDNADQSDYDWLVIKYAPDGDDGLGQRVWTKSYESAEGRIEKAWDVALDVEGDLLVGGNQQDAEGISHWRLARLDGNSGCLLNEQVWDADRHQGVFAIDFRQDVAGRDLIALGGYSNNGADDDMHTLLLEYAPEESAVSSWVWVAFGGLALAAVVFLGGLLSFLRGRESG